MAKYVTIEEAAKTLGKTVEQVREMMNAGELRGMMADGTFKFKEEDVAALAGGEAKEDTLMSIDGDVLFAESDSGQSADAAAETWIAADMENVFESDDFSLDSAGGAAEDLQPAPLALSPESDDTSLGAVLMEEEGAPAVIGGDEPVISIDPESGIATITSPTPGISRTHMIVVSEPEPRHKAFTPLLVVAVIVLGYGLYGVASTMLSGVTGSMDWAVQNLLYLLGGAALVAGIAFVVGLVLDKQKAASEAAAARLGRR